MGLWSSCSPRVVCGRVSAIWGADRERGVARLCPGPSVSDMLGWGWWWWWGDAEENDFARDVGDAWAGGSLWLIGERWICCTF